MSTHLKARGYYNDHRKERCYKDEIDISLILSKDGYFQADEAG